MFALLLACQATWILAAEFSRPILPDFPANMQTAAAAAAKRNAAAKAASIGLIRADLWANYALTYPELFQHNEQSDASGRVSETIEQARQVAERALAYAPYDARIWLGLANLNSRFDWLNGKPSAALRMSYYTGANEVELIPLRLSLAVSFSVISDADFQQFVRHDIRTVVTRAPQLKNAILESYRYALPAGQQFIEETLKDVDPTLLSTLHSKQ